MFSGLERIDEVVDELTDASVSDRANARLVTRLGQPLIDSPADAARYSPMRPSPRAPGAGVRATQPYPRLLDGVVGLARGVQDLLGDGSKPGPVLLESFCQPVAMLVR